MSVLFKFKTAQGEAAIVIENVLCVENVTHEVAGKKKYFVRFYFSEPLGEATYTDIPFGDPANAALLFKEATAAIEAKYDIPEGE